MGPGPPARRLVEGTSLMATFTRDQVEAHVVSLRAASFATPARIKQRCLPLLKGLMELQFAFVFNTPVDHVALNLHDYTSVVRRPMDLGTIKRRLETGYYRSFDEFAHDCRLTFDNAMVYNERGSDVHNLGREMSNRFEAAFDELRAAADKEEAARRAVAGTCYLCGAAKLTYEPMVYYCNGAACAGLRIPRNRNFYVGGNNQYFWCQGCYAELDEGPIEMAEATLQKSQLVKRKNDEVREEPWVACDHCKRKTHQVCALYNGRSAAGSGKSNGGNGGGGGSNGGGSGSNGGGGQAAPFHCPECVLQRRESAASAVAAAGGPAIMMESAAAGGRASMVAAVALAAAAPAPRALGAADLPHTRCTDFIEQRVRRRLELEYIALAGTEVPTCAVARPEPVHVRMVSCVDRTHVVKPRMRERYRSRGCAVEFPCRSKCFVLFQNLDGADTILFGMYVYEYGHKCPPPNQRRVHISYLDSVHFFRPRELRTAVYQEVLVAYLAYVRNRGFHTAHLWACPPLKGDDYILYCHPEDQRTPKDDRLRLWYTDMLGRAQSEGVVHSYGNIYDEYWGGGGGRVADASALPYLEGDYWVGEAENILKEQEEEAAAAATPAAPPSTRSNGGGGSAGGCGGGGESKKGRGKGKGKGKDKGKGRAAADGGMAADGGLAADDDDDPPPDDGDVLMERLGQCLEHMKENFIVARLLAPEFGDAMTARLAGETARREAAAATAAAAAVASGGHGGAVLEAAEAGIAPDETEDTDELLECEFFDTRQAFLNLCQVNHYQFDMLRRAKHASMMVLYHLHNPDAPKFVVLCSACQQEITSGKRYHCDVCSFELCGACHSCKGVLAHPHPLRAVAVAGGGANGKAGQGGSVVSAQDRAVRRRQLEQHMVVLKHACRCPGGASCQYEEPCNRMKQLLHHTGSCAVRVAGGCMMCRRVWALLTLHAKQCRETGCIVPRCQQLQENARFMSLQQSAMEDRRRAAMNVRRGEYQQQLQQ
ncbi:unnamed protein product, partial [Phaeothamnion confervicola]